MKRFILSAIFVATVITGFGQTHAKLSFAFSPSVNWMITNNSDTESGKAILGYDFGLNGDFYFSEDERYSFSTGIQISNVGGEISYLTDSPFQFSEETLSSMSKIKYHLRYVEIPFDIKLKTDQFHRTRYWGLFGFSTMLNIKAKGDSNDGILYKADIHDEVNLFNLAMNVGIGFDFDLGTSNTVSTGLIFQNGLMDVTTDNDFTDKTIINSMKLKVAFIF
ncbi:MAG TPA: outer membrane beta-barrel protein [Prolixibacteraceae bacterium]|nr:outer membrane beta-barrel protein [Prolixibacteraceae bacterium]